MNGSDSLISTWWRRKGIQSPHGQRHGQLIGKMNHMASLRKRSLSPYAPFQCQARLAYSQLVHKHVISSPRHYARNNSNNIKISLKTCITGVYSKICTIIKCTSLSFDTYNNIWMQTPSCTWKESSAGLRISHVYKQYPVKKEGPVKKTNIRTRSDTSNHQRISTKSYMEAAMSKPIKTEDPPNTK